jgi:hypothetical protein
VSNDNQQPAGAGVIRMAQARASRVRQRADANVATPERMIALADAIIEHHDLIVDSETANESKGSQVFKRDQLANTLAPITDEMLDTLVFQAEPHHVAKGRTEVVAFIRKTLNSSTTRAIKFSQVAAVAFADQLEVLCFKRLAVTTAEAANITLESLPGFKHVIGLTNDPKALTLWIGSLLDWKSARTQYLHWYGGGGNGKSTVFQAISDALGRERVIHTRMEDFTGPHWGEQLVGARLLLFPDANSTRAFSGGKFKEVTGEEYITINPKNRAHRKARLTNKTAILSNRKISITNDEADRRRLLPIISQPDTEADHGNKSWYHDVRNNGERILLYCYQEYVKELAVNPGIRSYIEPDKEAQAEAVEERYGDWLAVLDEVVIAKPNDPLQPSVMVTELFAKVEEVMGRVPSQTDKAMIREALSTLGIEKCKLKKGRVFKPCVLKGG